MNSTKRRTSESADARIGVGRKLRSPDKLSRTMANGRRNRIGLCIAEAPSGVGAFRLKIHLVPQRMGAMTMIAVLILCALLICLFRLDLDDAESQG